MPGEHLGILTERDRECPQQPLPPHSQQRLVVRGDRLGETRQCRPGVGAQHRIAGQVIRIVGGQVQRGVERLLQIRGGPPLESFLTDGHIAAVAPGQPDVVAHLLFHRQREELLDRSQHLLEQRLVDAGAADVEEADLRCRPADLGGHPLLLGTLR